MGKEECSSPVPLPVSWQQTRNASAEIPTGLSTMCYGQGTAGRCVQDFSKALVLVFFFFELFDKLKSCSVCHVVVKGD